MQERSVVMLISRRIDIGYIRYNFTLLGTIHNNGTISAPIVDDRNMCRNLPPERIGERNYSVSDRPKLLIANFENLNMRSRKIDTGTAAQIIE